MASKSGSAVIVWCYLSHNRWIPFEPPVSNHIENAKVGCNSNRLDIGLISQQYFAHEIDIQRQLLLTPSQEGKEYPITRRVCPPGSLFSNNARWEFDSNCLEWAAFDIDTAQLIEDAVIYRGKGKDKKQGCSELDLRGINGLPYIINVKKKFQTNITTLRERKIRRHIFPQNYVIDTTWSPSDNTSGPGLGGSIVVGSASDNRDTTGSESGVGVMTRKRKQIIFSSPTKARSLKGTKSSPDQPCIMTGRKVTLPKVMTLTLNKCEGVNDDSVGEFLMKYTQPIRMNSEKAENCSTKKCDQDSDDGNDLDEDKNKNVNEINDYKDMNVGKGNVDGCDREDEEDESECAICFDKLKGPSGYGEDEEDSKDISELVKCHHTFHKLCLVQMYKSCGKDGFLECPSCKCVHGERVGNCPAGSMTWNYRKDLILPGHEDCNGTLEVTYKIPRGIQSQGHPMPGKPFNARGFPRRGYIPDSDKGRMVLKLLMEAFQRRLMFTVGTSATTGESSTVIWNDIHHKTEATSNYSGHGYPDPNYLDNVSLELMAQGVTEEILKDDI